MAKQYEEADSRQPRKARAQVNTQDCGEVKARGGVASFSAAAIQPVRFLGFSVIT